MDCPFKANFKNKYQNDISCPIGCKDSMNQPIADTQQHMLDCQIRISLDTDQQSKKKVVYEHLFSKNMGRLRELIDLYDQRIKKCSKYTQDHSIGPPKH